MSNMNVKFIGKEYSIPEDVIAYVGLVDFTNEIRDALMASFKRKIGSNIDVIESDDFMIADLSEQASKFVRKLLDNDVYNRTANDYFQNNKGYDLFVDTKKKVLRQLISIRKEKLETYRAGVEDAIHRKESSVTGLDFGIISSSFVNHMIYAYMDASKQTKQEKEALKTYNREIAELDKQAAEYDRQENAYISENVIPAMNTVFTFFAYELLDKYVSDLIKAGKFDKVALDYIDLERSNDLLKNLGLSNKRTAILESAFVACPFNIAVYMQAMKYDLLDYDSFQTAKVFKQDHHVLSFFRESWGEVSFPAKFNINYHCINVWASLTGKSSFDLLRGLTEQYATGVMKAYSRVADIMADKSTCCKIIGELREDVILSGASICVGKAREYVEPIVPATIWEQLTERCGHTDLLSRIKKCFPSVEELQSKKDFDSSVTEQLAARFEDARKELAEQIEARRAEEERQRIEREKQKAEQARIQAEKKAKRTAAVKKGAKRTLIVIGAIVAVCIALVIAGIIFLFATDKPIDNDFSERTEYSLHSLTYFAPENWKEDSEYNQSNENTKIHVRYDNWGKFVCMMGVVYHGETQHISIEDVVSDYTSEYKDATTKSRQIGEQEFTVISYVRTDDYNGCNVYVTESESSVFEIYFRSVPESTNPVIFDEIVGTIAFDDYVNPKEEAYNEALSLMSAEKYDEAISMFTELDGYKGSAEMIAQCQTAIWDDMLENAKRLIEKGNYYDAIDVLEKLGEHGDSKEQLKIAQYGYANSLFNDGKYNDAATIFKGLGNYENSIEMFNQSQYAYALSLMNSQSYDAAIALFDELSNYAPAKEKSSECKYILAMKCIDIFDYDGAKGYLNQILDYKDAEKYKSLLDNIVSDIYRDVGDFIWLVSKIDTSTCSSTLVMYTGRGSMKKDDKYSIDFSSTVWYEWKVVDSKYYMTSTGEQGDFYYVVALNNGSLTEQFHNSDGTTNEKYTYHILSDEESEPLKKNWIQYFEDDEYGYWASYEWVYAEATVK